VIVAVADAMMFMSDKSASSTTAESHISNVPHWFRTISKAARQVQQSKGEEYNEAIRLLRLGQRRAPSFTSSGTNPLPDLDGFGLSLSAVDEYVPPSPYFGLTDSGLFFRLFGQTEKK
jgi:hypothetical protein